MLIELLKSQLEVSNETNIRLNATVRSLQATIDDLRKTIADLEALLKERDETIDKANSQMRGSEGHVPSEEVREDRRCDNNCGSSE